MFDTEASITAFTTPVAIFGAPDAGLWGMLVGGDQPRLALVGGGDVSGNLQLQAADLSGNDDRAWAVASAGSKLRLEATTPAAAAASGEPRMVAVRVTGSASIAGHLQQIEIPGVLGDLTLSERGDSARLLGCWFSGGHEVGLLALRPHGAKGHDRDAISAIALGETGAVFDPRFSTTYNTDGRPREAALELWIGSDPDGDQHPSRIAAVATGACAITEVAGVQIQACAMRCLHRGQGGAGVYVLARTA